jgi:hypothetical protein
VESYPLDECFAVELLPLTALQDWLVGRQREPERAYGVIDIDETVRPDDLVAYLAALVRRSKLDPTHVDRIATALGWGAIRARLAPGRPRVRRGEFGEVLAGGVAEEIEGWQVPVPKLRFQIDPEQTQPGTDIVAFMVDRADVTALLFLESKLRGSVDNQAAVAAHSQLSDDQKKPSFFAAGIPPGAASTEFS